MQIEKKFNPSMLMIKPSKRNVKVSVKHIEMVEKNYITNTNKDSIHLIFKNCEYLCLNTEQISIEDNVTAVIDYFKLNYL